MALETATFISDLVSTNPTSSDNISDGDNHLRLLKSTVKATFPNVSGAVTPTHTELNYVDGVTSAIQTQLDAKSAIAASNTFTANQVVNVTDNTNAALRITQAGTGNALLVEDSASTDATPTVIDASGRVVVGHTSALSAGGTIAPFQVVGTSNATSMIQNYRYSADTSPPFVTFAKSRAAALGGSAVVASGDDLGSLVWRGDDGTNFVAGSIIGTKVDAAPSTGNMPSALFFSTSVSAGTVLERMRITSAGNVGIGTSSPGSGTKLNVAGRGLFTDGVHDPFDSTASGVSISYNTVGDFGHIAAVQTGVAAKTLRLGGADLQFYALGSERLRIDTNGYVLVTSPTGLGYGTGSGGTVTQATNKSTAVTLNKPNGFITMNSSALAANTSTGFTLTDSTISNTDVIIVNVNSGVTNPINYNVWGKCNAGSASIYLRNISGGSLSEAVVLSFAIIKGATS